MLKKTKSILEELDSMCPASEKKHVIETRASNVMASAIRLVEMIETCYSEEEAENLVRKLLNSIKLKNQDRFVRALRKTNAGK